MFIVRLKKVIGAFGQERWREASCSLALEVSRKDEGKPYQLTDHKPTANELVDLCHEFSNSVTQCMKDRAVVAETRRAWKEYLTEYRIGPLDSDLYKLAYWYGEAIVKLLQASGQRAEIVGAAKIHRLNVMDSFLFQHVRKDLTRDIFFKLCLTSLRNKEQENLGKYGTYLIFKSTSLQLDTGD